MAGHVKLGCGLIAIGRPWGTTPEVPTETDALLFLDEAFDSGIRHFDTAPSYGLSEERLGKFLDSISDEDRAEITVSTKCGEYWDPQSRIGYMDHSYNTLRRSISHSMELLGGIAIMQRTSDKHQAAVDAFRYILQTDFDGVILTGTSNQAHLTENLAAFQAAHQAD